MKSYSKFSLLTERTWEVNLKIFLICADLDIAIKEKKEMFM